MSQATESTTTSAPVTSRSLTFKVRAPREVWDGIEAWAERHGLSRSEAVRILALRGLSFTA